MDVRFKKAAAISSDLDPRITDRGPVDFEATMWTGTSLTRSVEQRFPTQPAMPDKHPSLEVFKRDPKELLPHQMNALSSEFWQRVLRHSNQAAVAKYIANMRKNDEISEEQAYRHVDLMHELDKTVREEITRHDILRRISLTRAAHFFARMHSKEQRNFITGFQHLRALGEQAQVIIERWHRHERRAMDEEATMSRHMETRARALNEATAEARRHMAAAEATRRYEAAAKMNLKLANRDFEARNYELNLISLQLDEASLRRKKAGG